MKQMPFHRRGSTSDRKMWAITVFLFAGFLLLPSSARAGEVDPLQTRAKLGEVKAQVQLGEKYIRGEGVPQNYTEAYRWFAKAAERGNPAGQYRIGQMYAQGLGVLRDDAEAVRWYFLSAEQGYPDAEYELGEMYMDGRGVLRNEAEAGKWYRKAAEQGHTARVDWGTTRRRRNGSGKRRKGGTRRHNVISAFFITTVAAFRGTMAKRCDGTGRQPNRASRTRRTGWD